MVIVKKNTTGNTKTNNLSILNILLLNFFHQMYTCIHSAILVSAIRKAVLCINDKEIIQMCHVIKIFLSYLSVLISLPES